MDKRQVIRAARPVYGRPPTRVQPSRRPDWKRFKRFIRPLLVIIVMLWVWSWFNVKQIQVIGAKQIEPARIKQSVKQILQQHFWTNNLLALDGVGVAAQVTQSQPELKTVKVRRNWPNRLVVSISEKQPALWWQTGLQNYLLDADGSIIGLADNSKPLVTVIDSTNLPVKPGDRVVPPSFIKFCTYLIQNLPAKAGISISSFKVPDTTSEVYGTTNKGYLIKFDTTRPAEEQINDLVSVIKALTQIKKTPSEYIDLRIQHKAYYR